MVYFDQHIVFPAETQFYLDMLILALFLLAVAIAFVGVMIYQLIVVVRMQSEIWEVGKRSQTRKVERKKE